jgi:hypothetical protein
VNKKTGAGGEIYGDNYMNQSLGKSYDVDIVDTMTQMLADELTKSIDTQILNELFSKRNRRKIKIENLFK